MAVAAKEPERDLSDMMGGLMIADERGGKHKKGCVDSQDSLNSAGRPIGADAFNRLRDRLKDRVEQKHREERIKKETLKVAANVHATEPPRRQMNRTALPPPARPLQLPPPRFIPSPHMRPLAPPLRPVQPETDFRANFEADVDAGHPLLPILLDVEDGKKKKMMVRSIIERQMMEESRTRADSSCYGQFSQGDLSPKICDFGSQNASVVSSGSMDGFSPEQSSSSSPPSISYALHQSHSMSLCMTDFPPGNDLNSFEDSSN